MSSRVSNRIRVEATGHVHPSLTVGIDLASQPSKTAVCVIDWGSTPAQITNAAAGNATDDDLITWLETAAVAKAAIDAPFGFPMAFVDGLTTYQGGGPWPMLEPVELRFRQTEHHVKSVTGQSALSAITDDLVWPTIRCARLLSRMTNQTVDRAGGGLVVEVYPAAALRIWLGSEVAGGALPSYKGSKPGRSDRRQEIIDALRTQLDGEVMITGEFEQACVANDDQLDAFVCALIARLAANGVVQPIPVGSRWAASREGWIALPHADIPLSKGLATSGFVSDS